MCFGGGGLKPTLRNVPNHRRLLDALLLAFRPARWSIFGFRFVPLMLFAAGIWAVVYGGFYHRIPVSETHDEQFTIEEPVPGWKPPPMPPDRAGEMPSFSATDAFGQSTDAPGPPPEAFVPPVKLVQLVKTVKTTSAEWEVAVNRAVTVAGMIREHGEIVRVPGAMEGPGFCPS